MALSTFANGRLWGARYGAGQPWVLALHGWARDHHDFDTVFAGQPALDALALDLPGFGVAPEPDGPWSTLDYARYVAPVLGEMAAAPIVILGHSFGARVAVQLAGLQRRPSDGGAVGTSVGALVLVGAPLAPFPGAPRRKGAWGYRAGKVLHRAGVVGDERMEELRRRHGSPDYRNATPVMRGVLVRSVQETATAAYVPTLRDWAESGGALELVWGEDDREASLGALLAALASTPEVRARSTVVPGMGHLLAPPLAAQVSVALLRHRPAL